MGDNEKLKGYYRQRLADGVCKFFRSNDVTSLSVLFNDLAFYMAYPKEAESLKKKILLDY